MSAAARGSGSENRSEMVNLDSEEPKNRAAVAQWIEHLSSEQTDGYAVAPRVGV